MQLKDYYKILELEPNATLPEIKKAYRRLAHQYHPDKNSGAYAQAYFAEVKEAYEVLTNPARKQHYLQQRWYQQSVGKKDFSTQPVTASLVLKQSLELDKYVSSLDSFRMDKEGLYEHINTILSNDAIEQLTNFNEADINKEIIRSIIHTASYLQHGQAKNIASKLYILGRNNLASISQINSFLLQIERKAQWEKYKIMIVIVITIIISLLIYFVGSR
jgi:molecular chaperone DnaJ